MKETHSDVTVSVIVLTYNHERFICHALDSILMQVTDFTYEILIGDDASSDHTPDILREYQRRYPDIIKLSLLEENRGATQNAYGLLNLAQGKYIAACEGDDYWLVPDKLQKQVDFLDAHPEYIGCAHKCRIIDEDGISWRRQKLRWVTNKRIYTLRDFRGLILPGQAATIVRRNIYCNPKYDYSIFVKAHPQIGDRTTTLIYAAQGDFYCFPDVMSCYRKRRKATSLTTQTYTQTIDSVWQDFLYTRRLEDYAKNVLKIDAGFRYHKRDLLTSALLYWLVGNRMKGQDVICQIVKSERAGWRMFAYVPFGVLKKLFSRLIG